MVTLIGVVHIGDPRYYQILQRLLDDGEKTGALVHFEAVMRPKDAEVLASLTDLERQALTVLSDLTTFLEHLVTATTDLVAQKSSITYRPTWVNADVNAIDFIRMLGPQTVIDRLSHHPDLDDINTLPRWVPIGWLLRFVLRYLGALHPALHALGSGPLDRGVVLEWRNLVAASAALSAPDGAHVMAIWGAAHLPGIGALLERNGFVLSETRWVPAIGRR